MRINDIILESNTEEGIGSAIGSIAGGLAKGAGAVVGGIRGAGDAFGKGYTAGRSAVSGDSKQAINQAKAQKLRAQADQLDGGSSAQSYNNSNNTAAIGNNAVPNNTASSPAVSGTPAVNNNTGASTAVSGSNAIGNAGDVSAPKSAEVANPLSDKSLLTSLQHLKGDDVERVRTMLQKRVAMGESVELDEFDLKGMASNAKKGIGNFVKGAKFGYNDPTRATNLSKNPNTGTMTKAGRIAGKLGTQAVQGIKTGASKAADIAKATPGALATAAGKVAAIPTHMKQDYQMARGALMSMLDLHQAVAAFSSDDAKKVLGYFNTIHPEQEQPAQSQAEPADQTQATGTDGKPNLKLHQGGLSESRVGYQSRFLGIEI